MELTLPATAASVPQVRRAVAELARECGGGPRVVADVALAVTEACAAVVVAAGDGERPAAALHVSAGCAGETFEVVVRGAGPSTPGAGAPEAEPAVGMALMAAVAASVELDERDAATLLTLTFDLGGGERAPDGPHETRLSPPRDG